MSTFKNFNDQSPNDVETDMEFQETKGYFMEMMLSKEVEEEPKTLKSKMKLKITTTKEYPTWIQATMRVVK